jgi:hypothetical protein
VVICRGWLDDGLVETVLRLISSLGADRFRNTMFSRSFRVTRSREIDVRETLLRVSFVSLFVVLDVVVRVAPPGLPSTVRVTRLTTPLLSEGRQRSPE